MSNNMFANPKAALGFAGVTIAIAVAATFGVSAFVPSDEAEEEAPVVAETEAEPAQVASNAPPPPAWGGGDNSGGWGAQEADPASGSGDSSSPDDVSDGNGPTFGDFSADDRSSRSNRSESSSSRSGSSGSRPTVTSSASADAPELSRPGTGPAPQLTQAE